MLVICLWIILFLSPIVHEEDCAFKYILSNNYDAQQSFISLVMSCTLEVSDDCGKYAMSGCWKCEIVTFVLCSKCLINKVHEKIVNFLLLVWSAKYSTGMASWDVIFARVHKLHAAWRLLFCFFPMQLWFEKKKQFDRLEQVHVCKTKSCIRQVVDCKPYRLNAS